jgi:hypothetical protein
MALFSRRKRLAEIADREAAGESFWTQKFDESARAKVVLAFQEATGDALLQCSAVARRLIMHDEGRFYLFQEDTDDIPDFDLLNFMMKCGDDMAPTVIEAMSQACADRRLIAAFSNWDGMQLFDARITITLREHRISYDLIDHQMVPFSTRELHQEVVAPSLRLLAGRKDLDKVEAAYRSALEEITHGKPDDAITDAGTALQEMLGALGCSGNALGPLIKSAKSKGILAPHDSPMLAAIEGIMHWVSADRSAMGDAHAVTSPSLDDAWLITHIVGAIILRLSKSNPRT